MYMNYVHIYACMCMLACLADYFSFPRFIIKYVNILFHAHSMQVRIAHSIQLITGVVSLCLFCHLSCRYGLLPPSFWPSAIPSMSRSDLNAPINSTSLQTDSSPPAATKRALRLSPAFPSIAFHPQCVGMEPDASI